MATARQNLNSQLDQDLILKLRAIISSDIHDFDKLNDEDKKTLYVASLTAGYKTNLELWLYLHEHPEAIGLPPLSPKVVEQATVDAHLLAALTAEFETDKLEGKLDSTFKDRSEKDRARIRQILLMMVRREQARLLAAKTDPKNQGLINSIHHQVDPKEDSYSSIRQTAADIIAVSIPQTNLVYTQEQTDQAISTLVTASIARLYDSTDTDSTNTAIQVALSSNEEYQTDITAIVRQIEDNLTFTPTPIYQSSAFTQVTPNISITLDKIILPSVEIDPVKAGLSLPLPLQDQAEKAEEIAGKFSDKIFSNPSTQLVLADLNNTITPEQEKELTAILIAENLVIQSYPTPTGEATAVTIATLDPGNHLLDAATVRIASMGLDIKKLDQHLSQKSDSKSTSFFHEHPQVLTKLRVGLLQLENPENKLGQEIKGSLGDLIRSTRTPPTAPTPRTPEGKPGPFAGLAARYQTITNKISGLLPGRAGQIFNVVTHPIQFIQSKIGSFVGKQIIGKFKTFLIEKVGAKIANESFKRAAQFVLKEGLQKGLEKVASFAIAKIGGTALVAGISAALGISTGGVSLVIQAAVMAAMWVGEKVFGLVKNIANGLARTLTGEDFDWKPIAAAPLLLLGGAGTLIGGLGAAASIAAMSAGVALLISTIVGFFFYITVITVAPIISTIAQLDSGLGPQQGPAFNLTSPPYTGPILPGCSKLWPVAGGLVIQGPHGTYSHQTIEAVDILVPIGTPVKSVSTGTVAKTGWGDAYGNWIWVTSTSQDGKTYSAIYGHLSEIGVAVGSKVGVGTAIALSGATSSVPGFANPHLHIEYRGLAYNACPGGGIQIPDGCYSAIIGRSNACLINGKPIYTN